MIEKNIQTLFIIILNPIYSAIGKISERVRAFIVQTLWFVIFGYFIIIRSAFAKGSFIVMVFPERSDRHLFCTIVLLLIGIFSINSPLKRVPWRKLIIIPQLILGVSIIIISYVHPVGDDYRLLGFQLLLVFPLLYFIWNNRGDYSAILRPVVTAMTSSGMILYLVTVLFALSGDLIIEQNGRCMGIMGNSNCFSLVGLELLIGGIYLAISERVKLNNVIYNSLSIGMGLGTILLGQMRISIIAVAVCLPVTVYYYLRYLKDRITKKKAIYIVVGLLIFVTLVSFSESMIGINYDAIQKKQAALAAEEIKDSGLPPEEPVRGGLDEVQGERKDIIDRLTPDEGETLDRYSSGRIRIWTNYAYELNWLGNNYDEYDWEKMGVPAFAKYAHNFFLEVAYRFGIPVGMLMTLYVLFCGIVSLRYLFFDKKKNQPYKLLVIFSMIIFALEALLDCAVLPFFQAEALMFYLSAMMIIDNRI